MKILAFLDETSSAVAPIAAERNLRLEIAVAGEVAAENDEGVEAEKDQEGAAAETENGPGERSQERKRNAREAEGVDQEKEREAAHVKEREPDAAEAVIASETGKASATKGRIKTSARRVCRSLRKRM